MKVTTKTKQTVKHCGHAPCLRSWPEELLRTGPPPLGLERALRGPS